MTLQMKLKDVNRLLHHHLVNNCTGGATVIDPVVEYKAKKKTISKNTILRGTKTIESEEDIEAVLDEIRKQLQKELEDASVIKLV